MKNIFSKIMATLAALLSSVTLFVPQLALADNFSDYYSSVVVPEMGYNNNDNRQSTGVKYYCKFVDEKGKIIKSDNLYDETTLSHVQKLLDNENNNVKNIKNGEFKPSIKSLSCQKKSNLDGYAIAPIEFSCRTLDNKNRVLDDKKYNIVQVLNNIERVDAENENVASKKTNSTNNLPKKRFQCVNVGETYDIFDGKAENNAKHSQQTDVWSHIKNVSKFTAFGIIAFIASIIVIAIIPLMHLKTYKK